MPEIFIEAADFGSKNGQLLFSSHNAQWKSIYEFQEIEIRSITMDQMIIDHIGSTAIPDLLAKPIIDMAIGLKDWKGMPELESRLKYLGFKCKGENGIPGRIYFIKGTDDSAFFHIHVFLQSNDKYNDHLEFKSRLMRNPILRAQYERYKIDSSGKSRTDYAEGKDPIIREILAHID